MAIPNIFFFFALFFLQLHLAFGNVALNTILSTNDQNAPWLSPSGEFAFGFHRIENTNLFLLATWFNNIPSKTIVWYANMPNPAVPSGSRVQLTPTGLNLTNPQGQAMWTTGELQGYVSYAEMRDDGNFVLASSNSSYLWQSFNNPTDTLMPNQSLPLNGMLSSRFSQTNYTKGRFALYFKGAKFLLSQIAWPTEFLYNPYHEFDATSSDSVSGLVFNSSGNMYIGQKRVWDNLVVDVGRN